MEDFIKIENPSSLKEIKSCASKDFAIPDKVERIVSLIIRDIRNNGNNAVLKYVKRFDFPMANKIESIKVGNQEIEDGYKRVESENPGLIESLEVSINNISRYHREQLKNEPSGWEIKSRGKKLGQLINPLKRIGAYIPGGRYIYPSSILMTVIPALEAGVKEIVICSPPQQDGRLNDVLLYLYRRLGINEAYKIGGAQAIAFMAYGTESISSVDKIVGPGNVYVMTAKRMVYGAVGIDSLAGPSDITILADETGNCNFIAADLLSQAEHDVDSRSILLVSDITIAENVKSSIYMQLCKLSKKMENKSNVKVMQKSLTGNCRIIYNPDINLLVEFCNIIAPEHLEIMVKENKKIIEKIKNAGAIFIGPYTPVAVGDYIGGTNHVLPTNGTARFSSPLGVFDFLKKSSFTEYDKEALRKEKKYLENLSGYEGLYAHQNSVRIRFMEERKNECKN